MRRPRKKARRGRRERKTEDGSTAGGWVTPVVVAILCGFWYRCVHSYKGGIMTRRFVSGFFMCRDIVNSRGRVQLSFLCVLCGGGSLRSRGRGAPPRGRGSFMGASCSSRGWCPAFLRVSSRLAPACSMMFFLPRVNLCGSGVLLWMMGGRAVHWPSLLMTLEFRLSVLVSVRRRKTSVGSLCSVTKPLQDWSAPAPRRISVTGPPHRPLYGWHASSFEAEWAVLRVGSCKSCRLCPFCGSIKCWESVAGWLLVSGLTRPTAVVLFHRTSTQQC
ncbi:unnamed protein product [Ectocarpus sp. 12 AP-2014]